MIKNIIDELASNNSRLFKEELLKKNSDNNLLKQVFWMTYNPTINFYIKKTPKQTETGTTNLNDALHLFIEFSERIVTGNAAIARLQQIVNMVSADDYAVIQLIIKRDLRCGVSVSTINKIWPGLIPEFPYMRCSLPKHTDISNWDWAGGIYSQLKADGMYAALSVNSNSKISIRSRNGSVFPLDEFNDIIEDCSNIKNNTETHGELVVYETGKPLPRQISNGLLNSVLQGNALERGVIVFEVWDQIPLENAVPSGKYDVEYDARFANLLSQLESAKCIKMIETKIVYSIDEAYDHYTEMTSNGLEGTIIKTADCIWEDNTSKKQVKLKVECVVEVKAIGLTQGNGKNESLFGAITYESSDGLFTGNASGFPDAMRKEIAENWDFYNGKIMAICINSIMPPSGKKTTYSSFLPRFVEWRDDKTDADSLHQIQDQYDSVIKGK